MPGSPATPSTHDVETTLDRYFALSDTAGHSSHDFEELIGLFTPEATLQPASGPAVRGQEAIREFFRTFLAHNTETRHLWRTRTTEDGSISVDWAVAARRASGDMVALSGTDTAVLAPDGRIDYLRVAVAGRP